MFLFYKKNLLLDAVSVETTCTIAHTKKVLSTCVLLFCCVLVFGQKGNNTPTNILLITADDLNYSSVGIYGSKTPDITPHVDRLAKTGVRFNNAHVTVAVCMPSRNAILTGLYPFHSGVEGFVKVEKRVPTIMSVLKSHGYFCGVLSKVPHCSPSVISDWDTEISANELGVGRDKDKYADKVRELIRQNQKEKRPFFLMVNAGDPHRPFSGSDQEKEKGYLKKVPLPSRTYSPKEIEVPGFLPDIPDVRKEVAEYYSSVKRMDDVVGAVLKVLKDEKVANNTLIIYLSDNGMSFPFSKTNCYLNSTKTPLIISWPGHLKQNYIDTENFVSGVDLLPTILDAVQISNPLQVDGQSFYDILNGKTKTGASKVFTQYNETSAGARFPIRCVQDKKYGYIFNIWANGKTEFKAEAQKGRSWDAMVLAAKDNPDIAKRTQFFSYRTREEFYDMEKDPDALNNLINDPAYRKAIDEKRKELMDWMVATSDPALVAFKNRQDEAFLAHYMKDIDKSTKIKKGKKMNTEKDE